MSLKKIAQTLTKELDDNEKLLAPVLSGKLNQLAETHPTDQTIVQIASVMSRLADKNMFICKKDFKDLYKKFYTSKTAFASYFPEVEVLAEPVIKSAPQEALDPSQYVNSALTEALASIFDGTKFKGYSTKLANKACSEISSTLDSWNLAPKSVSVSDGNEKFLVLKADYETPKGLTSFYVPVVVNDENIEEFSVFLTNAGVNDLNNKNVKSYLQSNAGGKLNVSPKKVLEVLAAAVTEKREITSTELAIAKLAEKRSNPEALAQSILLEKIAEVQPDIQNPGAGEYASVSEQFGSPDGAAAFDFGSAKVEAGRSVIARELKTMGYGNCQIKVARHDSKKVFYAVGLNSRTGFIVPIKMAETVGFPTIVMTNGEVHGFDKESIDALDSSGIGDLGAVAAASPRSGLRPSELIEVIKVAMVEGNIAKAEDALNVLKNSGDEVAYNNGFNHYMSGLNPSNLVVEASSGCSFIIKNAKTSQYALCGHTNLPLHKVYQDKFGQCLPNYRKNMDETSEAVSLIVNKINFQ